MPLNVMAKGPLPSLRNLAGLLVLAASSLTLIGCDDAYSPQVEYSLRKDPLVLSTELGADQLDPDRPGVFPIMSPLDLLNPANPMYPKRDTLFKDQKILRDPNLVGRAAKQLIKKFLDDNFDTPREPRVKVDQAAIDTLKLDEATLARGSVLYRVNCLHCHGVSGDGRGVTAKWINPHPRDFRQGLFKFQSVNQTKAQSPPRRDDLRRVLTVGIEGTAMPAFNLLPSADIEALISYVMHLSIRGEVEFKTIQHFDFDEKKNALVFPEDEAIEDYMQTMFDKTVEKWVNAQNPTNAIKIRPYPFKEGVDNDEFKASVLRGYNNFLGNVTKDTPEAKQLNCVSCHVNFGRQAMFKWDEWGTLVRPNNLTTGIYRGGRRTIDLYYRIHSGINGSKMLAFGGAESRDPTAIWDLVNFVQVLPYPAMREKLGISID